MSDYPSFIYCIFVRFWTPRELLCDIGFSSEICIVITWFRVQLFGINKGPVIFHVEGWAGEKIWAVKFSTWSPPLGYANNKWPRYAELSLDYLKDSKFYRESKASFIHISSTASFKPFLIVWWWEYCTFSDSSVVSFRSSSLPKYTQHGTIFPKKSFYYQTFFLLQICYLLDRS